MDQNFQFFIFSDKYEQINVVIYMHMCGKTSLELHNVLIGCSWAQSKSHPLDLDYIYVSFDDPKLFIVCTMCHSDPTLYC